MSWVPPIRAISLPSPRLRDRTNDGVGDVATGFLHVNRFPSLGYFMVSGASLEDLAMMPRRSNEYVHCGLVKPGIEQRLAGERIDGQACFVPSYVQT